MTKMNWFILVVLIGVGTFMYVTESQASAFCKDSNKNHEFAYRIFESTSHAREGEYSILLEGTASKFMHQVQHSVVVGSVHPDYLAVIESVFLIKDPNMSTHWLGIFDENECFIARFQVPNEVVENVLSSMMKDGHIFIWQRWGNDV